LCGKAEQPVPAVRVVTLAVDRKLSDS
jgi:hypothetical protein